MDILPLRSAARAATYVVGYTVGRSRMEQQHLADWLRRKSDGVKHRGISVLPHATRWAVQGGRLV